VVAAGLTGPAATDAPLPAREAHRRQLAKPKGKASDGDEAETLY